MTERAEVVLEERIRLIDETGNRYGLLTVQRHAGRANHGMALWETLCDCGESRLVRGSELRAGKASHCGSVACKAKWAAQRAAKKTATQTEGQNLMVANPLQGLMDQVQKQLDAVSKDAVDRAATLKALADRYAEACRNDATNALAARLTATTPTTPTAEDAALALWEAVQQLPEIQRLETAVPQPANVVSMPARPVVDSDFSRIRALCHSKALAIVGGVPVGDRLNWLRNRTVKSAAWVRITRDRDQKDTESAVGRIRGKEFAAIIVIDLDVREVMRRQIEAEALRAGVHVVVAENNGVDALHSALVELDRQLTPYVNGARG